MFSPVATQRQRHCRRRFLGASPLAIVSLLTAMWGVSSLRPAHAADKLLFCNTPERMLSGGAYADAHLTGGQTYRIFFHYRNGTPSTAPLVVAFHGSAGKPLTLAVRKGMATPQMDPSEAGKQAMARFLKSPQKHYVGSKGAARFPLTLDRLEVASGVLSVRADQDVRLRIYFKHNNKVVPGAQVVAVDAPRRDYAIALTPGKQQQQYFRIGVPEKGMSKHMDGTYGLVYSFKVSAPAGSKVRVAFSPRGGKSGLVGTINGVLRQSRIVGAAVWSGFAEAVVGKDGLVVTTLPFGGVFYPVELVFQLV